jgi:hypothetical protein
MGVHASSFSGTCSPVEARFSVASMARRVLNGFAVIGISGGGVPKTLNNGLYP